MICRIRLSHVRAMSTGEPLSKVDVSSNDQRLNIDVHSHASLIDVTGSSQMCLGVFSHGSRIRADLRAYSKAHLYCSRTRFMPTHQFNTTVDDVTTPFDVASMRDAAR